MEATESDQFRYTIQMQKSKSVIQIRCNIPFNDHPGRLVGSKRYKYEGRRYLGFNRDLKSKFQSAYIYFSLSLQCLCQVFYLLQ